MYVIAGATGNTGRVVAARLLDHGERVRVLSRNRKRLEALAKKGAEPFDADMTDPAALTLAFRGAKAVYAMIPHSAAAPDAREFHERVGNALAEAFQSVGVKYAVVLSSMGADKPTGTGPVTGLHNLEQKLSRVSTLNALFIRAGYFMENLLAQIAVIRDFDVMAGPFRRDLPVPMIATRDIGTWAAEALLKRDFRGKQVRDLLGQRDVTFREVASIIGRAIDRPGLSYKQFPAGQIRLALVQSGMSPSVADLILEMSEAMNTGYMAALEPRSPENTTPTSIETFVEEVFVPRFMGKAVIAG